METNRTPIPASTSRDPTPAAGASAAVGPPRCPVSGRLLPIPIELRFWTKIDRRGENDCWEWKGARTTQGYGRAWDGSRWLRAHRVAWELTQGRKIPSGLYACHSCDNPPCCNPSHLFIGTAADNNRDKGRKGRSSWSKKTHCPQGHPYSAENTYVLWGKYRRCRICLRASTAAWYRKRKQEAA